MKRRILIAVLAVVLCLSSVLISPIGYVSADSEVAETDMVTGKLMYITLKRILISDGMRTVSRRRAMRSTWMTRKV